MGYSPTRSSPRASWTGWSTAPITCSCRARATAPTSAPAPTGPTRHKEVAQARTLPVGMSDSLIDPLVNSLIVHTLPTRPHAPEVLDVGVAVGHIEAGSVDGHQWSSGQPRTLAAGTRHGHRGPVEQFLDRRDSQPLSGLADRRGRRHLPVIYPGAHLTQAPYQAAHHLLVGLVEEQPHRDQVPDHHVRRQAATPPFPAPGPVDDLLKQIPMEPGRQHTEPDVVSQPTTRAVLHTGLFP